MTRAATFALLLLSATAHADTLADVRAALQTLHGEQPLHASYEVHVTQTGDDAYTSAGAVNVRIDTDGLTITFPPPMLEKLATQPARGEGKSSGVRAANVQPSNVAQLLNYAPVLLRQLEKAKILRDTPAPVNGQLGHVLVVNVPQSINLPKMVKGDVTETLTLFIGADHLPVSSEESSKFSVGVLFLKMDGTAKESMTFAHRDDRLIVTRHAAESQSSGFGQSGRQVESETIAVK